MTKGKIIIFSACGAVVVVGLILGLTLGLGGSKSGETPGKKVMADTRAYLMELQRILDDKGQYNTPTICWCCEKAVLDESGECPYCKGSCDQGSAADNRRKIIKNAPVTVVEVGSAGDTDGGNGGNGGGCGDH
jgi:hypothetical protein